MVGSFIGILSLVNCLGEYFVDIPDELKDDAQYLIDYVRDEKNGKYSVSLDGLTNNELQEISHLELNSETEKKLPDTLKDCKNLNFLFIRGAYYDLEGLNELKNLKVLGLFNEKNKNFDYHKLFSSLDKVIIFTGNSDFITETSSFTNLLACLVRPSFDIISNFPSKLEKAISLLLVGCSLNPLPDLSNFKNLVELNLRDTQIESLPPSIGNMESLRVLSLNGNQIHHLPQEFFKLRKLEKLDITGNNFDSLPNELFEQKNLKEIYLSENPYRNAPNLKIANEVDKGRLLDGNMSFFQVLKQLNKPTTQPNYNHFNLKIPKELRTPMLQYIEFFKDYVEATKGKEIIFEIKRDQEGLILVTNGNTNVDLSDLGAYFQEYVELTNQQSEDWIFNFEQPTSAMKADIFRLKMENEIGRFKNALNIAKLENAGLNNQLSDAKSEIKFLRDLSQSFVNKIELLGGASIPEILSVDQLLLDIQDQAIRMLERKGNHQLEDLHNDILTEFLRQKGYYASDQTRSGRAKLGVGEIDIMIRKENGTPFSIIEAFRLNSCGEDNKTIAAHLDKLLHDYDTAGHERNFVIVYAEAKNFMRLWGNYKTYVSELNGKPSFRADFPLISFKETTDISTKTSIKIGLANHRREGGIVEVYHVFINMFA